MTQSLSERLRKWLRYDVQAPPYIVHEAADEIDRLNAEIADQREAEIARLNSALEVRAWTKEEREGMAHAFKVACEHHGFYETLFAVGAWLLRHRAALKSEALFPSDQPAKLGSGQPLAIIGTDSPK